MGMSTHAVGFVPPDEKHEQMSNVWFACKAAKMPVPYEVEAFFDGEEPSPHGREVRLRTHEWSDGDMRVGVEINVDELPENVKVIRFYNSY